MHQVVMLRYFGGVEIERIDRALIDLIAERIRVAQDAPYEVVGLHRSRGKTPDRYHGLETHHPAKGSPPTLRFTSSAERRTS